MWRIVENVGESVDLPVRCEIVAADDSWRSHSYPCRCTRIVRKKPVAPNDHFRHNPVAMDDQLRLVIRSKLGEAIREPFPTFTRREASAPPLRNKARAVIGMRRAGKTTFLHQCLADRLAKGVERERLVYFNFEDERLGELAAADLGLILDEYYRAFPKYRRSKQVTWCFDEIQTIPGWEKFIRRVMDAENVEILLSGSSAKMLSREVATTMRGRALETIITPFNFREFVRARGATLPTERQLMSPRDESGWLAHFDDYVLTGGFPEACQEELATSRVELLQGYVETVLFRDVAERHGVANLVALRAFVRQLLRQPAASLSITKVHADFRSRGIGVAKETLMAFLTHLEDAFLVFTLPIASHSERRQQVNPRKVYVSDHALAAAFQPTADGNRGHHLENIVACELQRRCAALAYVKTASGLEVDFLATALDGSQQLVQVAADLRGTGTLERELRALAAAGEEFPKARKLLLAETAVARGATIPTDVESQSIWRWLLDWLVQ